MSQYFNLSYTRRDTNGDTDLEVSINFENPKKIESIVEKINSWLIAIGHENLEVVSK